MRKYVGIFLAAVLGLLSCGRDTSVRTTISWWHFWTDATIKPVIQEIVADFERGHPGVTVELVDLTWADGHDKIAIAFSAGAGPDVVELGSDWVPEFSSTGHLHDITAAVDSILDDYLMWEPGLYRDRTYAVPWILGTRVLYANTDLLTQAGYDADYSPTDWPGLLAASRAIHTLGDDVYGFGSNSAERHRLYKKFLPFLWSNGGSILSEDGASCRLDAPAAVAALTYYLSLCETGLTDTQRRLEDAFLDNKIGFVVSGDWLLKRIAREKPEFRYSTHLIPPPEAGMPSVSFAGGEYLAINAASPHPDIALDLIRHICSPANQLRFCLQNCTANPSSRQAAADSTFLAQPHFDTFVRQMATSRMSPVHPEWVYIEGKLEKAIEAALYNTKTPARALHDAAREIEELLAP